MNPCGGSWKTADSIRVRSGKPHQEIRYLAKRILADLIVLGAHSKSQLRDLFLGNTSERVIQTSEQSVLEVKTSPEQIYQRVLVAVDFSEIRRRAIEKAAMLAPDAKLHLVHVPGRSPDGRMQKQQPAETEYAAAEMRAIEKTAEKLDALID